jgi:hypothetical protein
MFETSTKAFFWVALIATVLCFGTCVVQCTKYDSNIGTYVTLAKNAKSIDGMVDNLTILQKNLVRLNANTGYSSVFSRESTDLSFYYDKISRLIADLEIQMQKAGVEQLTADPYISLKDYRALQALDNPSWDIVWVRWGWWLMLILLIPWVLFIVVGVSNSDIDL